MNNMQPTPRDILNAHGGILVSRAVERDDEVTEALFAVATEGRAEWTHRDAVRLVDSLKSCKITISKWLELRAKHTGENHGQRK